MIRSVQHFGRKLHRLALLALCTVSSAAYAQNGGTVTGVVKNEKGDVIPGVTVGVINADSTVRKGGFTDGTGVFTIADVPAGGPYSISFTSIGYEKHFLKDYHLKAGEKVSLLIRLREAATELNQLVVVGYGSQKKSNVSTAVSTVKSDFIGKQSILRVEQALQGSAPGVVVLNPSGQPGEKPMIRIRGTGTNGDPEPLYIVDGFPVSSIEYLNPGDIDRIDVLKDAASAAIYGARGANGVVLITTKKGRSGASTLTYEGYYGIQNRWRTVPVLNATEYATMMNEGARNSGQAEKYANPSLFGKGTNWQDETFTRNAPVTNHQVTVAGGNDKATYLASFSIFDQQGIVGGPKSRFQRYTVRLSGDQRIKDFLKVGAGLNYIFTDQKGISSNEDYGGIMNNAINLDPLTPAYETDPTRLNNPAIYPRNAVRNGDRYYGISSVITDGPTNPLASIAIANAFNKNDRLLGNAYAEANIWDGLKFRSSFGIELGNNSRRSLSPAYYMSSGSKSDINTVAQSHSRAYIWQLENVLSYNQTFNQHTIEVIAGQSALKRSPMSLEGTRSDTIPVSPEMAYLDMVFDINSSRNKGSATASALVSYFGRLSYDYAGKYLFSATLRRDGSSRFGRNNPFATFPSLSGGWVISKEDFYESNAVSFLKLRASWGRNGSENIGDFAWASAIAFGNGYTYVNSTGQEYYFNGTALGPVPNPNLKWETSEQTNFGADLELLNGRLGLAADYYIKNTIDLLFSPSIPALVGFSAPVVNGGSVRNQGVELGINYRNRQEGDWKYNVSLNMSYNKNEVTAINNASKSLNGSGYIGVGAVNRMQVGLPIGYFWGYKTAGIFQSQDEVNEHKNKDGKVIQPRAVPGDIRFVDLDGNGALGDGDKTMIGNPNPKVTAGFNFNLSYKQFDLSMFVFGMFGHELINGVYRYDIREANMPGIYLDRWTPENPGAKYPRFTFADNNGNRNRMSDIYVEKGDFVRLKNLQVGYTVSPELLGKAKLNTFRVYVSADNLLTFTKFSGFDPEIGARSPLNIGIDHGVYPQARTFRAGVQLSL